jgi:hypothetical protein
MTFRLLGAIVVFTRWGYCRRACEDTMKNYKFHKSLNQADLEKYGGFNIYLLGDAPRREEKMKSDI